MRLYEIVMVLKTSLSDKEREKWLETVKGWVKDFKVTNEEHWGQKPLAYKIKKEVAGVYHKIELEGENSLPADLEKRLINTEHVLRHLIFRKK